VNLLFVASDPMEFRGLLAHATAVREAQSSELKKPVMARWSRLAKLGSDEVLFVADGAGPDRAAAATDAGVKSFDAQAIISTGFCGALSPELGIADLVSATSIEASDHTYMCAMCDRPPSLSPARSVPHPGAIRSIPYIAQTAEQKRNLAANGAIAVEMEAAGIAARAESYGLPLYCIRAVTDLAGETLANDFNKALRLDGQFDTILILKGSLLHPLVRLPELFRLRKRCMRAAHVLGDFFAYSRI